MILGSKNNDQGSDGDVGDKAPGIVDGPAMGIGSSSSSGMSSNPRGVLRWVGSDIASGLCSASVLCWLSHPL
jgi:hypothetical protein